VNVETEAAETHNPGAPTLDRWIARKIQPAVVFYVAVVFAAFGLVALLVFHSPAAVKALFLAAIAAIAATIPGVMEKIEYRLTDSGIDRRSLNPKKPDEFQPVFSWDRLSRIVPMKHGFKYFTVMDETRPLRRFWKLHLSDRFSGEVHLETQDRDRILRTVEQHADQVPGQG
jgi:hypothetical protein